jgi:hypothetical protein
MDNMFLFTGFCLEDKFFSAKRDVFAEDDVCVLPAKP